LIKEEFKTENNLIKGCQSKVWLQGEQNTDKVVFTADSDAILTKGIIAILIRVSLIKVQLTLLLPIWFIDQIGLKNIYRLHALTD
jgi:cysteine desulfuration protein SufE